LYRDWREALASLKLFEKGLVDSSEVLGPLDGQVFTPR
jgi:hypothetical protein